jgi:hypothetical protein
MTVNVMAPCSGDIAQCTNTNVLKIAVVKH